LRNWDFESSEEDAEIVMKAPGVAEEAQPAFGNHKVRGSRKDLNGLGAGDPHGVWQWKQIGFSGGSEADFENELLQRLDSAKTGKKSSMSRQRVRFTV
jgi:hypothetical protein